MKQTLLNYLKNLSGWHTKRKIVVISVDDYGNVRLDSAKARHQMDKAGLKVFSRFDRYDTLENNLDLEMLYETLGSVKDKNNNPAIFTAFAVPCNIDFEKMANDNFEQYHYELLPQTFDKKSALDPKNYQNTWQFWKEGMERKLIHPEFHGREHFNLKVFNEKLTKRDHSLLTALKNRSLTSIKDTGYSTISFTAAFDFYHFDENNAFESNIKDGLNQFEKVFGFRARHFNPPGGREHPVIHQWLKDGGVAYLDTILLKQEHQGNGKYKRILNWTGKKNQSGQILQVRNCVFEPTHNIGFDWVNYTFKQREAAFFMHKPAIISSHRVNFCGHIDPDNRKKGLNALKQLLKKTIAKYPDVEFMTSTELGNLIKSNT